MGQQGEGLGEMAGVDVGVKSAFKSRVHSSSRIDFQSTFNIQPDIKFNLTLPDQLVSDRVMLVGWIGSNFSGQAYL